MGPNNESVDGENDQMKGKRRVHQPQSPRFANLNNFLCRNIFRRMQMIFIYIDILQQHQCSSGGAKEVQIEENSSLPTMHMPRGCFKGV